MPPEATREKRVFLGLLIAFAGQVAGRLVDLRWHLSHEEFEGGAEQLQAHWLIWLSTVFVFAVAVVARREVGDPGQRLGYAVVLGANVAYGFVAVIHFFQHLDHREVDWAHLLLAVTTIAAAFGVVWVVAARLQSKRREAVA
jgi:predicted permease